MQVSHAEGGGGGGGGGQTASGRAGKDRDKTICKVSGQKSNFRTLYCPTSKKKQPVLTETNRNTYFLLLLLWPNGSLCQCA